MMVYAGIDSKQITVRSWLPSAECGSSELMAQRNNLHKT